MSITNAKVLDFAMDIVEIDGEPIAKRERCRAASGCSGAPGVFATPWSPWARNKWNRVSAAGTGRTCSRRGTTGAPFCSGPSRLNR